MTRQQIEAWALRTFDMVKDKQKVEDSFVELKSTFIEAKKAARRIAGHANAARGEPILWIIGLDEDNGVVEVDATNLSDWWSQVTAYFMGLAPAMVDYIVTTDQGPLTVLFFDTSAAPYVVKNPSYGRPGGGPVEREVPWRAGTGVRSATREDLIRLLVPLTRLPDIEILDGWARVVRQSALEPGFGRISHSTQKGPHLEWEIYLKIYVTPQPREPVVFPVHRTRVIFEIRDSEYGKMVATDVHYEKPPLQTPRGVKSGSIFVEAAGPEAIVTLPGALSVKGYLFEPLRELPIDKHLGVTFAIRPSGAINEIQKSIVFEYYREEGPYRSWSL